MRLVVQVTAADRAEPRAVDAAEDLFRKREDDRIAGPRREIELRVAHVGRSQLVALGIRRLVLTRLDIEVDDGVGQTPVARAVEPRLEPQLEDVPGLRPADDELRGDLFG